ncbi:hypothetical protein GQ42DRAFT_155080 [Ramicandelaber brevisporus]|nr:hypothetical protein GQ42DRAFT_155080 [Ramicandelaber brevisporus]
MSNRLDRGRIKTLAEEIAEGEGRDSATLIDDSLLIYETLDYHLKTAQFARNIQPAVLTSRVAVSVHLACIDAGIPFSDATGAAKSVIEVAVYKDVLKRSKAVYMDVKQQKQPGVTMSNMDNRALQRGAAFSAQDDSQAPVQTIRELALKFGCTTMTPSAVGIFQSFRTNWLRTLPANQRAAVQWSRPVYGGAVFLACCKAGGIPGAATRLPASVATLCQTTTADINKIVALVEEYVPKEELDKVKDSNNDSMAVMAMSAVSRRRKRAADADDNEYDDEDGGDDNENSKKNDENAADEPKTPSRGRSKRVRMAEEDTNVTPRTTRVTRSASIQTNALDTPSRRQFAAAVLSAPTPHRNGTASTATAPSTPASAVHQRMLRSHVAAATTTPSKAPGMPPPRMKPLTPSATKVTSQQQHQPTATKQQQQQQQPRKKRTDVIGVTAMVTPGDYRDSARYAEWSSWRDKVIAAFSA